jgi:hypothetical protein
LNYEKCERHEKIEGGDKNLAGKQEEMRGGLTTNLANDTNLRWGGVGQYSIFNVQYPIFK